MDDRIKQCHLNRLRSRYSRSSKGEKGEILREVQEFLGVGNRQARRTMQPQKVGRPSKSARGRPGIYQDKDFQNALRMTWKYTNYMCSKRLKAALPEWLPYLIQDQPSVFTDDVVDRLLQVSTGTIDRRLKSFRATKGKSTTQPGGFRETIPLQGNIWNIEAPGHLEVDTVAHCGSSTTGQYINSLVAVDIATLWTEARAVFSKGSTPIVHGIEDIERSLPFLLRSYDSDNGTEVLNKHIYTYFTTEREERGLPPVTMTRSRAYNKNDQAHVEQRNDSLARNRLGYERLEFEELQPLVTHYYAYAVCPLMNHFYPTFKLKGKVRKKSRTYRRYDAPITPYERVMNSPHVTDKQKVALRQLHQRLNPISLTREEAMLRKQIDRALKACRAGQRQGKCFEIPPVPAHFLEYKASIMEAHFAARKSEGIVIELEMPLRKRAYA